MEQTIQAPENITFQDVLKMFAETDKRFKETDKKIKETSKQIKETAKQLKETDKQLKETGKQLKETDKKINALTGKWGKFVEGLIVPAVEKIFKERGIDVTRIYQRVRSRKEGRGMEIDILAVDGEFALLIEAKSTLGVDDVKEHMERLKNFKFFFPEYKDRNIIGALRELILTRARTDTHTKKGFLLLPKAGKP